MYIAYKMHRCTYTVIRLYASWIEGGEGSQMRQENLRIKIGVGKRTS